MLALRVVFPGSEDPPPEGTDETRERLGAVATYLFEQPFDKNHHNFSFSYPPARAARVISASFASSLVSFHSAKGLRSRNFGGASDKGRISAGTSMAATADSGADQNKHEMTTSSQIFSKPCNSQHALAGFSEGKAENRPPPTEAMRAPISITTF